MKETRGIVVRIAKISIPNSVWMALPVCLFMIILIGGCSETTPPSDPETIFVPDLGQFTSANSNVEQYKSPQSADYVQEVGGMAPSNPASATRLNTIQRSLSNDQPTVVVRRQHGVGGCGCNPVPPPQTGYHCNHCPNGQVCVLPPGQSIGGVCKDRILPVNPPPGQNHCGCNGNVCVACHHGQICSGAGGNPNMGFCCTQGTPGCQSCANQSGVPHCNL